MPTCDICGREPLRGNAVSHSNRKTLRRQKLNLQAKKVDGQRLKICTRCLKTLAKPKKTKN